MSPDFASTVKDFTIFLCEVLFHTVACWFAYLRSYVSPTQKSLKSDIVLITGAATGLGRQLCLQFAPLCDKIVAWDINTADLGTTAELVLKETGKNLHTYKCDLRDADAIFSVADRVLKEVGRVTILVNNAGVYTPKQLYETTKDDIEDIFKVNVFAHYHTVRAFLPSMMSMNRADTSQTARGHIVTISSIAGIVPANGMSLYGASKAATLLASECLQLELCANGMGKSIHVTRVLPFHMDTQMFGDLKFRHPWLFPTVDHIDCARTVVEAVRSNREVIYVYGRYRFLCILKYLLPWPILRRAFEFSGADKMFDQVRRMRRWA